MSDDRSPIRRSPKEIGSMALVFVFLLAIIYSVLPDAEDDIETNFCPQAEALKPVDSPFYSSEKFHTSEYERYSVGVMQGAIRVPTMSFDDMNGDPSKEPRFEVFKKLHEYLFATFPIAARYVENVNTYGLLYTIPGSDSSLKPAVFMAHQDVVPVPEATVDLWDYEPFSGHFDDEWIHGRGTADTKDSLVGILEAAEALLKQGWSPNRTIILSFGFDEEISGFRGAKILSETLEQRYGTNGVLMIVDEGFGMPELHGSLIGSLAVSEKGYLDITVDLNTPGGHSSVPPDHTGIGIMSRLVKYLEADPFTPELGDINPTLGLYRCAAEHSPHMNKELRRTILDLNSHDHRSKLTDYISGIHDQKYLIRSSQAIDVINGGIKLNALPERVTLKVNHRIDLNSGVNAVMDRFEEHVIEIARDFNLGVESDGETLLEHGVSGFFNITAGHTLEPSPISPQTGPIWDIITGNTRGALESFPYPTKELVMAPSLFWANTDTRYYWNLSRAIYRFKPALAEDTVNFHTVNERLRFRSHLLTVAWYYDLFQLIDKEIDTTKDLLIQ